MPETSVFFFKDGNRIPVLDWLKELKRTDRAVRRKRSFEANPDQHLFEGDVTNG